MLRIWRALSFFAGVLLLVTHSSNAATSVRVDQASTRFSIRNETPLVNLAVVNSLGRDFNAHVKIELIDSGSRVCANAERDQVITQGPSTIELPLALSVQLLSGASRRQLLWCRLRYQISEPKRAGAAIQGLISLSEITPDFFDLRVATSRQARPGSRLRSLVRTVHPIHQRPVSGVAVEGKIKLGRNALVASGATDDEGYALLDFDLPLGISTSEITLTVSGRLQGLSSEVEDEIPLDRQARILTSTDKPLYQPGQSLHIRALVFDSSNHAVPRQEATLKITDPDNTQVFRATVKTSRFGVASADWRIPDNARLGQYMVLVEMDNEHFHDSSGGQYVSISRYDLPNFSVSMKPDRAYYLPGQNAEVEVRADYLFGQPVKHAQARVVRETERQWDFKEQKWRIEEAEKYEGQIEDGRFTARIDLAKEHEEISEEDSTRFRDVEYAAYITDATTGRTEQRRFRLRVTREPIHLYVIDQPSAEGYPLKFYVSTFYADGSPAECEVAITEDPEWLADTGYAANEISAHPLRIIRTNRYGVAKIAELELAAHPMPRRDRYYGRDIGLIFDARDAKGGTGHHSEGFWLGYDKKSVVRVETNKPLYRPGEPIQVQIESSESDLSLVVDAARDSKVIHSRIVKLQNGRASVTVPYNAEFKDEVTIAAYSIGRTDAIAGSHTVLYPRERDLKLDVLLQQAVYKPGEEASADLRVQTADGHAVESALGVVVLDKAVEERARTNQEFDGAGFYNSFLRDRDLAGVTRKDLDRIDLTKPLPDDLSLVAEMLLNSGESYWPRILDTGGYETDQRKVFNPIIDVQLKPIKEALAARYARNATYPSTEAAVRRLLKDFGIDFDAMHDPWGTPYQTGFSIQNQMDVLQIVTAGADQRFGSADDFMAARMTWPYFRRDGEAIGRAINAYHHRNGGYIRDRVTFKRELSKQGIDIDALRDRWGRAYEFEFGADNTFFTVSVRSGGPNARFEAANNYSSDDFTIWTARIDYFAELRAKLDDAINSYFKATSHFPENETEFGVALTQAGIDRQALRDGRGRQCYVRFNSEAHYTDRVLVHVYGQYPNVPKQQTEVTPVTQLVNFVFVRSAGPDEKEGTADDFNLATMSRVVAEQSSKDAAPKPMRAAANVSLGSGSISGLVTDQFGAAIPGTKVIATHTASSLAYETLSDDSGKFLLPSLPAGSYEVRFLSRGFQLTTITEVPVFSSNITEVNASLQVGSASETVTVCASGDPLIETSTSNCALVTNAQVSSLPLLGRNINVVPKAGTSIQMATPRLREYFPETLLWAPSIETDLEGRAQLKFKLADNITTWKVGVIASTADGQIGIAEKELRAFQPFFVEHDPPRILTEGDEIMLPVVLRNYLDKPQSVNIEMKPEHWFQLMGPSVLKAEVPAGDATRQVFGFRVLASIVEGRQRVIATSADANDAIEKPVSVHPDGEEITETASRIFTASSTLDVNIPSTAIKGSTRGELKIYPNLMAHIVEGIEAIMRRPYGCGEQTISSTYPSLIVLRHYKQNSEDFPQVAEKARRYLQAGYERLLNYRSDDGGLTYWGRGEADTALTAYALRFLNDARDLIAIDEDVVTEARDWLIKHQRPDGSWLAHSSSTQEDLRQAASLTAFITRMLARASSRSISASGSDDDSKKKEQAAASALNRALDYIAKRSDQIDEPYAIASYALAAFDAGRTDAALRAVNRIRALARSEGDATYWALEANTPFYGWGLAGRVEATALAVQALARRAVTQDQMIDRGLLFLIRNKDSHGAWLSTQTTVNVMDAFNALLSEEPSGNLQQSNAEVLVNGRHVESVVIPAGRQSSMPIAIDLSKFLAAGANRVEIHSRGTSQATAQVVASYYTPWIGTPRPQKRDASAAVRLRVTFDKQEANVGDEITCRVEAERIGFRGYGMLLAEIGLPPGADVDRESIDRAIKTTGWDVDQYDVLPDRLIVYLWPRAGGTKFEFKFRARFGLSARTAPSVVYDYYNPEAKAVLAPIRFNIK